VRPPGPNRRDRTAGAHAGRSSFSTRPTRRFHDQAHVQAPRRPGRRGRPRRRTFRREGGSIVRRRGRRRGRLRRQQCPVVPVGSHLVGQQRRRALRRGRGDGNGELNGYSWGPGRDAAHNGKVARVMIAVDRLCGSRCQHLSSGSQRLGRAGSCARPQWIRARGHDRVALPHQAAARSRPVPDPPARRGRGRQPRAGASHDAQDPVRRKPPAPGKGGARAALRAAVSGGRADGRRRPGGGRTGRGSARRPYPWGRTYRARGW
jgi:hypothetical protein